MSFDADLLTLMPQTITFSTGTTRSVYGSLTFSTASRTMRARHVAENHEYRNQSGEAVSASGMLWVVSATGSTWTPRTEDRLTLADGTTPTILGVDTLPDENGTHHYRIHLGV